MFCKRMGDGIETGSAAAYSLIGEGIETGSMVYLIGDRAVWWHYIDKLSNETVPNHTFITTNHQALFIYNQTKITG